LLLFSQHWRQFNSIACNNANGQNNFAAMSIPSALFTFILLANWQQQVAQKQTPWAQLGIHSNQRGSSTIEFALAEEAALQIIGARHNF
jgi:hypothetical protein